MTQATKVLPSNLFQFGETWKDFYLELKTLKKGDIFYECSSQGENYELQAIEDAKKTKNGWICKVKTQSGETYDFYVSANTTYHGPNFFRVPQHLTKLDNGKLVYEII